MPDPNTQWIGLICLSQTVEPHFLKFYRNKKTNWSEVPNNPDELIKHNITSVSALEQFMTAENENWQDKWQETDRIELAFNRLILFRPAMFHSYSDVYGNTQDTGRLLQFFFLKPRIMLHTPEQQ